MHVDPLYSRTNVWAVRFRRGTLDPGSTLHSFIHRDKGENLCRNLVVHNYMLFCCSKLKEVTAPPLFCRHCHVTFLRLPQYTSGDNL